MVTCELITSVDWELISRELEAVVTGMMAIMVVEVGGGRCGTIVMVEVVSGDVVVAVLVVGGEVRVEVILVAIEVSVEVMGMAVGLTIVAVVEA